MKNLFVLSLLIISLSLNAQNWKRGLAIAGYHTLTIAAGAIGDAQYDMGNKPLGHALKAVEVGMLVSGPFIFRVERSEALSYILSYGFIRFSLFDSFYNMTCDLPILYNGSTSFYDRTMSTIPEHGRAWYKSFSLVAGFAIPITSLKW